MINKIMDAIKNGVFLWKTKKKIIETIQKKNNLLYIKDRDAKTVAYQYKDYKKLYTKYKTMIDRGDVPSSNHVLSDKVWVCWFQGYESAPPLVKACINSMHRVMQEKEIIILTKTNYKQYIELPDYIEEKFEKGKIGMAHFSDLLRISLLAKWGG